MLGPQLLNGDYSFLAGSEAAVDFPVAVLDRACVDKRWSGLPERMTLDLVTATRLEHSSSVSILFRDYEAVRLAFWNLWLGEWSKSNLAVELSQSWTVALGTAIRAQCSKSSSWQSSLFASCASLLIVHQTGTVESAAHGGQLLTAPTWVYQRC